MVMERNLVKVGNREVKKRYIGNKLIFEDLGDKTEPLSGTEIYTDKADDSVVHVEVDGKSYQHAGSGKNLMPLQGWGLEGDAYVDVDSGYIYSSYRNLAHSPCVKIKPNTDYTYSHHGHPHRARLQFLDINNDLITSEVSWGGAGILSSPNNAYYFRRYAADTSNQLELEGFMFQLEEGSTATEYEPPAPIEIHSLNDFDVMSSVGKRNYWAIAKEPWYEHIRHLGGGVFTNARDPQANAIALFKMSALEVPIGETYTLSFEINVSNEAIQFSNSRFYINGAVPRPSHNRPTLVKHEWVKVYATFDYAIENSRYVHMYLSNVTDVDTFQIRKFKLEKGDITTDWTLAPEDILEDNNHPLIDKINLLLDEPLRSVGDIKDRLFRDSDGIWKVERNVELIHPEDGTKTIEETYGVLDSPFYEILPQDDQDKLNNLRSFKNSNYVYTIVNDKTDTLSDYIADNLKPTLHTTFKSKGWYDYYLKTLLK